MDTSQPDVRLFRAQTFPGSRPADIVFDDAAIGLDHLRNLPNDEAQRASPVAVRRQTNFAQISFVWKLTQANRRPSLLRFERDYRFRELKANNAVLIGNCLSNPWVEPFEPKLGIGWTFDKTAAVYNPADMRAGGKRYQARPGEARESYFSVAPLPNLGAPGTC